MAYSNEAGPPKFILFYWQKSSLLANIQLRTKYRAKTLFNEKGESQVDEYSMSNDETDAFLLFAEQAFNDIFSIVLKMTTGVTTDPLIIDDTAYIGATGINNCYGFKIVDEDAYNVNNLLTVDDGVKQYIEAHIMASWYKLVGLKEEYALWESEKYDVRSDLLNKRLFQLRKPLLG